MNQNGQISPSSTLELGLRWLRDLSPQSLPSGQDQKSRPVQMLEMALGTASRRFLPNDYKIFSLSMKPRVRRTGGFKTTAKDKGVIASLNREPEMLNDKVKFAEVCLDAEISSPETLAIVGSEGETESQTFPVIASPQELFDWLRSFRWDTGLVLKPSNLNQGQGVRVIMAADSDNLTLSTGEKLPIKDLAVEVFSGDKAWLLQRRVIQHETLRSMNPTSLNTLRFGTLRSGSGESAEVHHVFATLRVGEGGSMIDDLDHGGYAAPVDMRTGRVSETAFRHPRTSTVEHRTHGSSSAVFGDVTLPNWSEVLDLADRVARLDMQNEFVGWDIGFSEEGPVVIEGNPDWCFRLAQVGRNGLLNDPEVLRAVEKVGGRSSQPRWMRRI